MIVQDPRTSTPGLGLLLWIKSIYGDEAADTWARLQPRIVAVTKGWSEAYFSLFLNGEAPMVLSYSTSPGYHMAVDETDRYQAAAFEEGHYLQVEVAAAAEADSPNRANSGGSSSQFLVTPARAGVHSARQRHVSRSIDRGRRHAGGVRPTHRAQRVSC